MKQILTLFVIIFALSLAAQTTQKGVVKEYNEKAQKTPLTGVELNVRAANSTVSDKEGNFTLQFLSLKPGEKVNVRRIEKLGYEVFNKEAIEQWNLNPKTPFVIVMCRSDRFKKIRDNYEKVSSESYARQLKKEEAALLKLKEQGKLKEAEYQKQLFELRENYENQLDNLENYVDRFSRIDLSELSAEEQEIIELVQEGRIDEAIAKYEDQNYIDKYIKEVEDIKEISSAIDQLSEVKESKIESRDSLLSAIDRQIETLKLAGGKENFDKIGVLLKDVYVADTTLYVSMNKYASYLYETKQFASALPLYERLRYVNTVRDNDKLLIITRLGLMEKDFEHFDKALFYLSEAENLIEDNPMVYSPDEKVGALLNMGILFHKQQEIDKAKICLEKAVALGDSLECPQLRLASVKVSLANVYSLEHENKLALKLYDDAYSIYTKQEDGSIDSHERIAGILMNKAQLHRNILELDESIACIVEAISFIGKCYDYNPRKYASQYIEVLNSAGNSYSDKEDYDKGEYYYKRALEIAEVKYKENPSLFWRSYFNPFTNIGILLTSTGRYQEAIDTFLKAIEIVKNAPESNFRSKNLGDTLYNLSYVYCLTDDYSQAIPLLEESLIYAEKLFSYNKRYGAMMYLKSLNNSAYCYDKITDFAKSKETYHKGIAIIEQLGLTDIVPFNSEYADFIYNLGQHIHNKENLFADAIPYYLKAYDIFEKLESENDILETSIGLAECFLKTGQIEKAMEWISKVQNDQVYDKHVGWWHIRGIIAMAMGEIDLAMKCREKILKIDPNAPIDEMELFTSKDL